MKIGKVKELLNALGENGYGDITVWLSDQDERYYTVCDVRKSENYIFLVADYVWEHVLPLGFVYVRLDKYSDREDLYVADIRTNRVFTIVDFHVDDGDFFLDICEV